MTSITITGTVSDADSSAPFSVTASQSVSGTLAGQPGNPVGHTAAPGYPGHLTPWSGGDVTVGGTAANPKVYSFIDFGGSNPAEQGIYVPASHVRFVGCRMQSNSTSNIVVDGIDTGFSYCSGVPLLSLVTQPPQGFIWPSAGVGMQLVPEDLANPTNPNPGLLNICIPNNKGYQYGLTINAGPCTVDHCDFWGWANAITLVGTTAAIAITNNWIHDNRHPGFQPNDDHGDGVGYLNGTTPPQNVTISGNVIVAEGNTNAIAAQGGTVAYKNWTVTNNYLSGFDITVIFGDGPLGGQNLLFNDNTIATDIPWLFNCVQDHAGVFRANGCSWKRNKFKVYPGTTQPPLQVQAGAFAWTPAMDGQFVWADGTVRPTDFV